MSKEETMEVLILKQTVAAKKNVRRGDKVDLPESEAKFLIQIKKAAKYSKELEAELAKEKKDAKAEVPQKPGKSQKPGKEAPPAE